MQTSDLKICYIISDIDKAVYFEQTAVELRSKGFDVSFILINCTNKSLHHFLIENGFTVFTLEMNSLIKSRKAISNCKAILKELEVELVHCHLAQANWVGLWASKLASIKTRIYTRHSGKPLKTHWKERIIDTLQNRLATKIIAISKNIDDLLENQDVPSRKRVLIHHGFDLKRFSEPNSLEVERIKKQYNPQERKPVIGVIARWLELKGIQFIIPAFEEVLIHYPNAKLCLFGYSKNTHYHDQLMDLISKLPANSYEIVSFEPNVYDLYQLFDVYVHIPINPFCEAFGQTYVESLAAGIPSVFTLSGIAREFIENGSNAITVPFQDTESTANAIKLILDDFAFASRLVENGMKTVRNQFSFEGYIEKLSAFYTSSISIEKNTRK